MSYDKICSSSNAMKLLIEKEYRRFDVEVVPFGINLKKFKALSNENNQFTVGTIKSIEKHNGINCLIDAAKLVRYKYKKNINFLIVGDGELKKEMIEKTKRLKLSNFVNFLGHKPHDEVVSYYNEISIFVAVSTRESFGVSVLEAAACGIPSITSNVGGLPEVNIDKKTGIVIDKDNPEKLAESIVMLFENEKMRNDFGNNARNRVQKHFNWKNNVEQMIKIYKSFRNI